MSRTEQYEYLPPHGSYRSGVKTLEQQFPMHADRARSIMRYAYEKEVAGLRSAGCSREHAHDTVARRLAHVFETTLAEAEGVIAGRDPMTGKDTRRSRRCR